MSTRTAADTDTKINFITVDSYEIIAQNKSHTLSDKSMSINKVSYNFKWTACQNLSLVKKQTKKPQKLKKKM